MSVRSWLDGLRSRLQNRRLRRTPETALNVRSRMMRRAETLQDRTLLTSQVLLLGTELQILTDADEDITVQEDAGAPGFVQVLIDSAVADSLPTVQTSLITQLTIIAGDSNNTIDVSGVTSAAFTSLQGLTIVSGDGDDVITGSDDFADNIDAGDGDDTVNGQGGDSIAGAGGGDTIIAGDGNDSVTGGDGDDSIDAGDGNDVVTGDAGDDTILGDDGLDTLSGNDDNDSIFGGHGGDLLMGDAGNDFLQGDLGNDQIIGGTESDTVFGGGGADSIDGEDGGDSLFGNSGNDTIAGSNDNDTIIGGNGNDSLDGNAGDDSIIGSNGNDTIRGGDGNDIALGAGGDDDINGQFGNDSLYGNSGDDTVCGGFGSDSLEGDAGDDLIQSICEPQTPIGISIGDANVGEGGSADVVLVVDQSGSTGAIFSGTPVGDINGDGSADTILDAELASLLAFQADLISRGVSANLSVIRFDDASAIEDMDPVAPGVQFTTTPTADADGNGISDFEEVVRSILSGGLTSFEPPLQDALTVFNTLSNTGGTLVFLSDGVPFDVGAYDDEVMALQALGIDLRAFGVGMGADLSALQIIDPSAMTVTTSQGLAMALTNIGVTSGTSSVDLILSAAPPVAFSVDFATSDGSATAGSDYTMASDTLNFAAGQTSTTLPVTILADMLTEGVETFTITLSNLQVLGPTITPFVIVDPIGQVNIFDSGLAVPANPPLPPPVTLPTVVRGVDFDPDTLLGDTGNDTIIADAGDDFIVGDQGNDLVLAGQGDDTVFGGAGNDTLMGEAGQDSLTGNGGMDSLLGGDGDDELVWRGSGDGDDTLEGGNGGNVGTVRGTSNANTFAIGQDINGRLTVTEGNSTVTFLDVDNINVNGNTGNDAVTVGDISSVGLVALTVSGGTGDDLIDASGGSLVSTRLVLNGNDGQDTISGSMNSETINGGADNDSLMGGGGDDTMTGGDGDDAMNGEAGDDLVDGGAGNDIVNGGDGNDSLVGGFDQDTLDGQDGDDTLVGGFGDDNLIGNRGDDSLLGGLGADTLVGAAGDDTLDGGRNDDVLLGNSGNDKLRGDHGDDRLVGLNGDDELNGGDGNDTIIAGTGNDGISGGDGDDFLQGDQGDDLIVGGDGNDNLVGGANNDTLLGEQGDDTLNGNGGTDTGNSGEGNNATENSVENIDINFELTSVLLDLIDGV